MSCKFVLMFMLGIMLAGDATAAIWFKGEAAIKDIVSNIEKHKFFIKWMKKAKGSEDAMTVQMTITPNSPVFGRVRQHGAEPFKLVFDMCDDKGKQIGEVTFTVPSDSWRWDPDWVAQYIRKWDRSFRYYGDDWLTSYKKLVNAYFHGFFDLPKECATLFLKSVRVAEEEVYYDLGNVGPKIVSNSLKSSIDRRSVRCDIDVKPMVPQEAGTSTGDPRDDDEELNGRRSVHRSEGVKVPGAENEDMESLRDQLRKQNEAIQEANDEIERLKLENEQLRKQCERLRSSRR